MSIRDILEDDDTSPEDTVNGMLRHGIVASFSNALGDRG